VPKDTGVTTAPAGTVLDSTRDGRVARGGVPSLLAAEYPALLVTPADSPVDQANPAVRPFPPDATVTVLVRYVCSVLDTAKAERDTSQTIKALKPDTRFSVVFFDDTAHMIEPAWMHTDADRTRALAVIAAQHTGGGTNPTQAFEFAFKTLDPLPDCIYYMTDGQTNADVVGILRLLNKGPNKTTVHAIAFGDQSLEMTMKQIAADNNGAYLFVP
jgi:hypothetical protein